MTIAADSTDSMVSKDDLQHDLNQVERLGPDAVEVVTFRDIHDMGAPLALSESARHQIYNVAVNDLAEQMQGKTP